MEDNNEKPVEKKGVKETIKDDIKNQWNDWVDESSEKLGGKDFSDANFSALGVTTSEDGVFIYNPKEGKYNWWIYAAGVVLAFVSILTLVFWVWIFLRNIIKVKDTPYKVVDYKRTGFEWLYNKTVKIEGTKYSKEFGKRVPLDKTQRYIVLFKAFIAFMLAANSYTTNIYQLSFLFGEEEQIKVVEYQIVNDQKLKQKANEASGKADFPYEMKCSFKYGTRVFTDTTVNFTVIKELNRGDVVTVDSSSAGWFYTSIGDSVGFVWGGHLKSLK